MRRAIWWILCVGVLLLAPTFSAHAEKRLALLVGINRYTNLPDDLQLRNAVNDAETLADTLRRLGFSVDLVRNPTLDEMIESVSKLAGQAAPGDTVLFFFSGHGMSPDSVNLLLPSDFPEITGDGPADRERARRSAYAESEVISAIRAKLGDAETGQEQGLIIFVSDACRNNPFAKASEQGTKSLVRVTHGVEAKPAEGVFSIYSAGLGQTALDGLSGADKNSVFMTEFVKYLTSSGRHLDDLMAEVKEHVAANAQTHIDEGTGKPHRQVPAIYDETVGGRIFLAGRSIGVEPNDPPSSPPEEQSHTPVLPAPTAPAPSDSGRSGERAYFACVQKDDPDCYDKFLRDFPDHPYAVQAETLLRAKTELPRYQACVDGASASERLRFCDLYLNAFPNGTYKDDAKTLREQAILESRPATTAPVQSLPPPQVGASPSFSCARASLAAEIAVCNSASLASLDNHLADLYASALQNRGSSYARDQQRSWLDRRNACGSDASCIEQRYREQISLLQGSSSPPDGAGHPDFSCTRARLAAEVAVCNSALLASLDSQLGALYASAKSSSRSRYYTQKQRSWIDRRNACGSNTSCLEQRYREQISFLQSD